MEQNKVKLIAENLIFDLKLQWVETTHFNEIAEDGSISLVENPYYYRLLDKITISINNTLNE